MNLQHISTLGAAHEADFSRRPLQNPQSLITLLPRQPTEGVAVGSTILPIGAIIGIAIAGSAIIFGILTLAFMQCLRSRYKTTKKVRDLDLSDDNEESVLEALQASQVSTGALGASIIYNPSRSRIEHSVKEMAEDYSFYGSLPKAIPQQVNFEITGLRDSWPLVGQVQSGNSPVHLDDRMVTDSFITEKPPPYPPYVMAADSQPIWPSRTVSRSCNSFNTPQERSNHSRNDSITSLKRHLNNRRSLSDNQLTSILRSTSQRLRDAQRRPISRTLSVLSQASGAPPTAKPPTPQSDWRGENREALIDNDSTSYVDSVRSSVLNMGTATLSPENNLRTGTGSATEAGREHSPAPSNLSEPDSLCLSNTPDVFIPAALSSPSKSGAGSHRHHKKSKSSAAISPTRSTRFFRKSSNFGTRSDMTLHRDFSNQISVENDPFLSDKDIDEPEFQLEPKKGPSSVAMKIRPEKDQNFRELQDTSLRLQVKSDDQQSSPKGKTGLKDTPPGTPSSVFQFTTHGSPQPVSSVGKKPTGVRQKGHKRRRTVHLSHLPRPVSVSVVLEEPESEFTPPRTENTTEKISSEVISLEGVADSLVAADPTNIPSSRPPSVPIFQQFIRLPSAGESLDSRRLSNASYSATMSFYDFYSSPDAICSSQDNGHDPCPIPSPSMKKSRRKGRNFSIDSSDTEGSGTLKARTFPLRLEFSPPKSAAAQFSTFDLPTDPLEHALSVAKLHGPRPQPQRVNTESITASVSMLRRMNSELSTYSLSSILTDQSKECPMPPSLRERDTSPSGRGSNGTLNYLSLGRIMPNLNWRRGETRGFQPIENGNALGLRMPILEHSPEKLATCDAACNKLGERREIANEAQQEFPTAPMPLLMNSPRVDICLSCNNPLLFPAINFRDDNLTSRYHFECQKCGTCGTDLQVGEAVDSSPFCKGHSQRELTKTSRVESSSSVHQDSSDRHGDDKEWSSHMSTPFKRNVRHESQMKMPSPQGHSPKSLINWRDSLGLYDDRGFLKSSPQRNGDNAAQLLGAEGLEA